MGKGGQTDCGAFAYPSAFAREKTNEVACKGDWSLFTLVIVGWLWYRDK